MRFPCGKGGFFFLLSIGIHCLLAYAISLLPQGSIPSFREGGAGLYRIKILENRVGPDLRDHGLQVVAERGKHRLDSRRDSALQKRLMRKRDSLNRRTPKFSDLRYPADGVGHLSIGRASDARVKGENIRGKTGEGEKGCKKASIGGGFIPPVPIFRKKPSYPPAAIKRGYAGRVLLRLFVSVAGDVSEVKLLRSSGYRVLDGAAIKAVKSWRFSPAVKGGRPVGLWVEVPIVFKLRDRMGYILNVPLTARDFVC